MRETGYFLPHSAISYLLVVLAAGVVWLVLHYALRIESDAVTLTSIIILPILFGVWSNRHAKMLWMALDLWMHPPTREDFESRGRS
jgi:hypothetical protein